MTSQLKLLQLKRLSNLMDSKFSGPFGFRFGLDGILGLIPVVGDLVTMAVSFYIIFQSAMLGCSPSVLLRMAINIIIENLIEMIPILGNVFDFIWKSNDKNIVLLESHILDPRGATVKSRLVLGFLALSLMTIFIGSVAITVYLIRLLL